MQSYQEKKVFLLTNERVCFALSEEESYRIEAIFKNLLEVCGVR